MTERQREKLEWLGSSASAGYVLDDNDRCEVRAALADLDAMTAARDRVMDEWIAARANLDACRALLREVEWPALGYDGVQHVDVCSLCLRSQYEGHASDCRLAAVLAAAGSERIQE